eukprot:7802228-Pyramimonas_sp.AAC.1
MRLGACRAAVQGRKNCPDLHSWRLPNGPGRLRNSPALFDSLAYAAPPTDWGGAGCVVWGLLVRVGVLSGASWTVVDADHGSRVAHTTKIEGSFREINYFGLWGPSWEASSTPFRL